MTVPNMWENNNMIQTVPNHQPVYVLIWFEMLESLTCYEMVGTPVHHHMMCILYFKQMVGLEMQRCVNKWGMCQVDRLFWAISLSGVYPVLGGSNKKNLEQNNKLLGTFNGSTD